MLYEMLFVMMALVRGRHVTQSHRESERRRECREILWKTVEHRQEGTSDEWNLASEMILERLNTSRTRAREKRNPFLCLSDSSFSCAAVLTCSLIHFVDRLHFSLSLSLRFFLQQKRLSLSVAFSCILDLESENCSSYMHTQTHAHTAGTILLFLNVQ